MSEPTRGLLQVLTSDGWKSMGETTFEPQMEVWALGQVARKTLTSFSRHLQLQTPRQSRYQLLMQIRRLTELWEAEKRAERKRIHTEYHRRRK